MGWSPRPGPRRRPERTIPVPAGPDGPFTVNVIGQNLGLDWPVFTTQAECSCGWTGPVEADPVHDTGLRRSVTAGVEHACATGHRPGALRGSFEFWGQHNTTYQSFDDGQGMVPCKLGGTR